MITASWGPPLKSLDPAPSRTVAGEVYERLRADIVGGRLEPGTKLASELLKERYQAGSSPLREALSHLAAEGLVSAEGQKGFRVAAVSLREFLDVCRLRLRLELQALHDAIRWGDAEWEVEIAARWHRLRLALAEAGDGGYADRWEASHRGFHFALLQGCRSPWLLGFIERLYDQHGRYRRVFVAYQAIPPDLMAEHGRMVDAALARDRDTAAGLLREHILRAAELTERDIRTAGIADAALVPEGFRRLLEEDAPPPPLSVPEARRARG